MKRAPAVTYLRVSTVEQARRGHEPEGFSIPAQREACERKAEQLEAEVIEQFVDRGESARSANRPELKRLLAYIAEHEVRYVIVHKIDRLARNLADHVEITLAIRKAGAELISVTETIDDTPLGEYMRTIFAANAQLYSANLAAEAKKGLQQKAKQGGTPGLAPLGYLNVRKLIDGFEVRTVEVDPERAHHVQWAFAAYASGGYTLDTLHAALARRGLTTRPTRKKPARPLSRSALAVMLANTYYVGTVTYGGVDYAGRHETLLDTDTFARVQAVLSGHAQSGEKDRKHHHYLKGTVYCGRCGSRLTYLRAKGNGGTYHYFACVGRVTGAGCSQPYLPAHLLEERVTDHWRGVQLSTDQLAEVRDALTIALAGMRAESGRELRRQRQRVAALTGERQKLLQAFYADAIALEQLKAEQDRIAGELAAADRRLAAAEHGVADVEAVLDQALTLARRCASGYAEAGPQTRRQWNQAFFEKLLVDADAIAGDERAVPFDDLTDPNLPHRLGSGPRSRGMRRETCTTSRVAAPRAAISDGPGSNEPLLVGATGFEPATARPPAECATRLRHAPSAARA